MKPVLLSPRALCDADDAKRWYDHCDEGLGSEFLRSVDECLGRIRRDPGRYRLFKPPYRKTLLRRFPYQVVYEERGESIWVLAVFHSSRDPKQLANRMR